MALLLEPFAETKFIFCGAQQARLLSRMLVTLEGLSAGMSDWPWRRRDTHIVEHKEDFGLQRLGGS